MSHFHFQKCDKNFVPIPVFGCLSSKTPIFPCRTFVALLPLKSVPNPVFGDFHPLFRTFRAETRVSRKPTKRPLRDPTKDCEQTISPNLKRVENAENEHPFVPKRSEIDFSPKKCDKSVTSAPKQRIVVDHDKQPIYDEPTDLSHFLVTLFDFKSVTGF